MAGVNRADYLRVSPYEADGGKKIGLEPSSVSKDGLRALGHPESPTDAIRSKCVDCSGGRLSEVRKCVAIDCPLWPFRMGHNPFHARAASRICAATVEDKDAPYDDPGADGHGDEKGAE
jgi:hypothetical protein